LVSVWGRLVVLKGFDATGGRSRVAKEKAGVMKSKEYFLKVIREELRDQVDRACIIRDDAVLVDLGLSSLQIIAVVLKLQRKHSLNVDRMIEFGMPATVDDLARLLESGAGTSEENGGTSSSNPVETRDNV
jgi:acyl carrier protein